MDRQLAVSSAPRRTQRYCMSWPQLLPLAVAAAAAAAHGARSRKQMIGKDQPHVGAQQRKSSAGDCSQAEL